MQYVQRLSQPSCTFIWTRVRDVNLALADPGGVSCCDVKGGAGLSGRGSSSVGSTATGLSLPICCAYPLSFGSMGKVVRGVGASEPAKGSSSSPGCGSPTMDV